jgi:ABC-type glycerol-3-phosphate transport system substrate-binding protein
LYQIGGVANETMVPLLDGGLIRPLDDLVAKYGQQLTPNQLIKVNGKIMAIAMQVNAQHLMYRADILEKLSIAPPKTYDEVLAAAAKIKASGLVEYPLGATMRAGWNLGEDFVNMYLGQGGVFFTPDGKSAIKSPAGIKTLETMKALTAYMDPEFLTHDSTSVQRQFQQGKIAMANFWASRAGALENPKESTVVGKVTMAAAPLAAAGKPATTLWWDGVVIARNITDEQADAAFRLVMRGLSRDMVTAHNDDSVWLIDGYKTTRLSDGVIQSVQGGAPAYPASAQFSLMHAALGNNLGDYFAGKMTAEQALDKVDAAYTTAAKSAGFIK